MKSKRIPGEYIIARRSPCKCGCHGKDPLHRASFRRRVRKAKGSETEGTVRLPFAMNRVRVTRKDYGNGHYGLWIVDPRSIQWKNFHGARKVHAVENVNEMTEANHPETRGPGSMTILTRDMKKHGLGELLSQLSCAVTGEAFAMKLEGKSAQSRLLFEYADKLLDLKTEYSKARTVAVEADRAGAR